MFHFLTKQNYSKYSQISMSMSFSSSEASSMFRSSTASATSESVIFSKGLSLFLSSRTDNCDFSCWRPAWQGSFGLKQWILSSSDPLFARFSAHDLNDSTITSFERTTHDSNIHWTIFFLGGGFMLPASVYWCTPSAIQWSYFVPMNSLMLVGHVPIELSILLWRFLKASEKNAAEVKVGGKRRREVGLVIPGHYKACTKSRSHCKILDRELNYMKTKYSHFEIEHELSEERKVHGLVQLLMESI